MVKIKNKLLKISTICLVFILTFSVFVSATFEITRFKTYVTSMVNSAYKTDYVHQITMNGRFTSTLNDIPYVYIQPKLTGTLNFDIYGVLSKDAYFKKREACFTLEKFQSVTNDWVVVADNSSDISSSYYYDWYVADKNSVDTCSHGFCNLNDYCSGSSFRPVVNAGDTYRFKIDDMFLPGATSDDKGYNLYNGRYLLEVFQIEKGSDLSVKNWLSNLKLNTVGFFDTALYDKDGKEVNATSINTDKSEITYHSANGQIITKPYIDLSFDESTGEITTVHPDNTVTSIVIDKANNSTTITETNMTTNTTIVNNYYTTPPTPTPTPTPGGGTGDTGGGTGDTGGSIWDRFLNAVASVVSRITEFLGTIITGILEGLVTIIDNVFKLFDKIVAMGSTFSDFIGSFFTFIPAEILTILTAGIGVAIFVAILKMLKG